MFVFNGCKISNIIVRIKFRFHTGPWTLDEQLNSVWHDFAKYFKQPKMYLQICQKSRLNENTCIVSCMNGFANFDTQQENNNTAWCGIVHWVCVLQFYLILQLFHRNIWEFLDIFLNYSIFGCHCSKQLAPSCHFCSSCQSEDS